MKWCSTDMSLPPNVPCSSLLGWISILFHSIPSHASRFISNPCCSFHKSSGLSSVITLSIFWIPSRIGFVYLFLFAYCLNLVTCFLSSAWLSSPSCFSSFFHPSLCFLYTYHGPASFFFFLSFAVDTKMKVHGLCLWLLPHLFVRCSPSTWGVLGTKDTQTKICNVIWREALWKANRRYNRSTEDTTPS